jgi:hypothetical protein
MAEVTTQSVQSVAERRNDAASAAKLRALARKRFEPREFVKTITPFEIAAIGVLALLVLAAIFVYSYWILPDQVSYSQLASTVEANRKQISELQAKIEDPSAIMGGFQRAQESLGAFRGEWLKPRLAGRLEIINAVGRVSRETGVRLTSGVSFTTTLPSEAADSPRRQSAEKKETTIRSYPSLGVSFSIAGTYSQVRNFISRFEANPQFVVINAVTVNTESSDTGAVARGPVAGGPAAVSMTISMTAYFQPETAPGTEVAAQ